MLGPGATLWKLGSSRLPLGTPPGVAPGGTAEPEPYVGPVLVPLGSGGGVEAAKVGLLVGALEATGVAE